MLTKLAVTVGGYAVAALLGWLLLETRENLGEVRESCNTRVAEAAAESERAVRETLSEAHQREIAQRDALLRAERSALRAARSQAEVAIADASEANAIILRLKAAAERENATLSEKCLLQPVPGPILDGMRSH